MIMPLLQHGGGYYFPWLFFSWQGEIRTLVDVALALEPPIVACRVQLCHFRAHHLVPFCGLSLDRADRLALQKGDQTK